MRILFFLYLYLQKFVGMDKRQFNRNFKLSVDGKFMGVDNSIVNTKLLLAKCDRLLRKESDRRKPPIKYPVKMRVSGHDVKLYAY